MRLVSAVGGVTDLGLGVSTGVDGGLAADVEAAPCTGFLTGGGHHDGSACGTAGVNHCALLYEDVVYLVVILGYDGHTGLDGQSGAGLYVKASGEGVCLTLFEDAVLGDVADEVYLRVNDLGIFLFAGYSHHSCSEGENEKFFVHF